MQNLYIYKIYIAELNAKSFPVIGDSVVYILIEFCTKHETLMI